MDRNRHKVLLDEWRERPRHAEQIFVSDGPVDWDRWSSTAKRRVLFLAKDAHGEGPSWDLSQWIREEGPKYNLWWNVGYWAYGIQRINAENVPANPAVEELWDEVTESLLTSAVINIKKSGGQSSSDNEDLRSYVKQDGDLIKEQVKCCNPQVMVCCGTWRLVKNLWGEAEEVSERVYRSNGMFILDYYHPSAHYPIVMHYYAAMVLVQKALGKV